jgi:uncharacterized membrane protein
MDHEATDRALDRNQTALVLVGLGLFVAGGAVLAIEPEWTTSPAGAGGALLAAGLTLMIMTIARLRRERKDEVVVDERIATIGEKSGYRAFQATFAAQGVVFAVVAVTDLDLPLTAVLGVLFAFTALVYVVAYNWYRRRM